MALLRAIAVAIFLLAGVICESNARPIQWPSKTVHISVEGKDLKDVLRDFAASQKIPAQIAPNVQGTVTGRFDMSPQRFFDTLAASFGFVWFYDGAVLSISNANEMTRQVIKMNYANTRQLAATLKKMKLSNSRFPVTYAEDARTAIVTGPAQYVQLVNDVARQLDQSIANQAGSVVRVFKLNHAWAADHKVQIDGEAVVIPGVANILSQLYASSSTLHNSGDGALPNVVTSNVRRLRQLSDVNGSSSGNGYPPPIPTLPDSPDGSLANLFSGKSPAAGSPDVDAADGKIIVSGGREVESANEKMLPVIEANPMTNSVLIRDTPQRIEQYSSIIEKLDVQPKLVEIEAHIIEIDDDALKQIGVDWRAHNSHVDVQTGTGTRQQNGYDGNLNPSFGRTAADNITLLDATPVGASISAVLGNAGRYLLARINALQQTSKAKIDATPKVATLDNVEAVMDSKTRFFIPVAGYTGGALYNVSVGTSLRVLPMVVESGGETKIKLNVHIEEGSITKGAVKEIPIIKTSEINTQAFVGENESLLIAGYKVEKQSTAEYGVPVLSKIPLLGALFRSRDNENSRMERIFLITPKVLSF
ncbi:type III secretion system outer membrane ring subunit SctC [Burkholderia singularis]|uniref:Type 3 secretion system secretin n=1 Tax=Burkholderia singularis TaxID=1503053 RepID=A0A238H418_9BURK|nr:type III secretion system outer membrane ring subunit SctC [Burkholderia singularis]SMF99972.1 Type III secretion outermembrane pore forming protein (YscC,MxiD,HrcC, InvG) [Burkholderia singularis]